MGKRQHRCPYYLLKITQKDLEIIKTKKSNTETNLSLYQKQINSLNLQFQLIKSVLEKIIDIIKPFLENKQTYTLEEVVQKSFLNNKTKSSVLSLIKKYSEYSNDNLKNSINYNNGEMEPKDIPNLFDPQNAYNFVTDPKNKYKRSTIKKNLNTLLRYIKLATKNPFLTYDLPVGFSKPAKLKHIITTEELSKFIKFLNQKKLYTIILICMLMYKFGLRVGAISKIKVSDILSNDVIIFKEKGSKIIKRKLLPETSNKIKENISSSLGLIILISFISLIKSLYIFSLKSIIKEDSGEKLNLFISIIKIK